ncbi:MAG TPA: type II secretion system protein [Terracidiphilus sp.]|nr:type II secretion system protein [Terracidiphilus sp.]
MSQDPIRRPIRPIRSGEEGFLMVAVMFLLAILVIGMAVAAPRIRDSIQREREVETMHRGKQYIRAVQLYYRKFHAYPPNVDALVKTNDIRFLRKKYIDPMTGKDDWKPILFGQNKSPTVFGFFGQALGGSSIAGTGPGGGNGLPGAQVPGAGVFNQTNQPGQAGSNSLFSNNDSSAAPQNGTGANPGNAAPGDNSNGANGSDASGNPAGGPGNGFGGQTFGGAGIIGFSPASEKQSILVYKKKNHYNEWEFVYDPMSEQMSGGAFGGGLNSQPIANTANPIGATQQNDLVPPQQPPSAPPPTSPPAPPQQ